MIVQTHIIRRNIEVDKSDIAVTNRRGYNVHSDMKSCDVRLIRPAQDGVSMRDSNLISKRNKLFMQ